MATKTSSRTTKTTTTKKSTKTSTTRKTTSKKSAVLETPVKKTRTRARKKLGDDKFKAIVILYNDRGKEKYATIDGIADFIDTFIDEQSNQYEIINKWESRIFNEEERYNGTMDLEVEKFVSEIKNK